MLKTSLTSIILFICCAMAFAQDKEPDRAEVGRLTDSVMAEGKALFRSEWASWHGTDIFMEQFKDRQYQIGGYVSYETPTSLVNVFFTKGDAPKTMGVITFGKDLNEKSYQMDTVPRPLNQTEQDLLALRIAAVKALRTDTTFKRYNNTDLNVVPFIRDGAKRIYILTAPKALGKVLYGNDYLLSADNNNQVTSVKRIHNSLISAEIKEKGQTLMHTHLVDKDEMMSATDICTTMLYEKENQLKQVYVASKKYVSIWDCEKDILVVMTKQAMERINADQKTRHPKQ